MTVYAIKVRKTDNFMNYWTFIIRRALCQTIPATSIMKDVVVSVSSASPLFDKKRAVSAAIYSHQIAIQYVTGLYGPVR